MQRKKRHLVKENREIGERGREKRRCRNAKTIERQRGRQPRTGMGTENARGSQDEKAGDTEAIKSA